MERIQFDTTVEEPGILRIPSEYARKLAKGEDVHVTITDKSQEKATVKLMTEKNLPSINLESLPAGSRRTRLVERMIDHPFNLPGFKPLTRDEIHDRDTDRNS
jgi:hypothetical protein